MIETTAFWGFVINNYDDTDLALVQQGYPDYVREIVYTKEEGKQNQTPHIQGWLKLQRQQRLSFVKKLFPRASFKALMRDEYVDNTKKYAQKLDETSVSAAVHKFNDPMKTIETVVKSVILEMWKDIQYEIYDNSLLLPYRKVAEKRMVEKDYKYAKIFVSSTYKHMWDEFGPAMYSCVVMEENRHTHTHTHSEKIFSHEEGTKDADEDKGANNEESTQSDEEGEDYEDSESETDEGYTESVSSSSSAAYDF